MKISINKQELEKIIKEYLSKNTGVEVNGIMFFEGASYLAISGCDCFIKDKE